MSEAYRLISKLDNCGSCKFFKLWKGFNARGECKKPRSGRTTTSAVLKKCGLFVPNYTSKRVKIIDYGKRVRKIFTQQKSKL